MADWVKRGQYGSIILLLSVVSLLVSMAAVMALQVTAATSRQAGLQTIQDTAKQILHFETRSQLAGFVQGVDASTLPASIQGTQTSAGVEFSINHTLEQLITNTLPINGFSLDSIYQGHHIITTSQVSTAVAQSPIRVTGLGCISAQPGNLPDQPQASYDIDLNQSSVSNVSYKFDVTTGEIWRNQSTSELLINFDLPSTRQFSRAELAMFELPYSPALAISFVIQNPGTVSGTEPNTLIVLFDQPLYSTATSLPVNSSELWDASLGGWPEAESRGIYLPLPSGQLQVSALTFYNYKLLFVTQSPFQDPGTGLVMYTNNLFIVDFMGESGISVSTSIIDNSPDTLTLSLNQSSPTTYSLGSQYQPDLIQLPGLCVQTYQYES